MHYLTSAPGRVAADIVNVKPNASYAPGTALAQQLLGGVAYYGLLACVLGLIGSVAYWGMGSFAGNPHTAGRGKLGVAVCIGGAVLIASAGALISWAAGRNI